MPCQSIYQLSAQGQVEAGTNHYYLDLRIGLSKQEKFYVIGNIPLFAQESWETFKKPYIVRCSSLVELELV